MSPAFMVMQREVESLLFLGKKESNNTNLITPVLGLICNFKIQFNPIQFISFQFNSTHFFLII